MKALFIGGTGTISMAITRSLATNPDWELYLLNRGSRSAELPSNVKVINVADVNDEASVAKAIGTCENPMFGLRIEPSIAFGSIVQVMTFPVFPCGITLRSTNQPFCAIIRPS